ncbi:unnamed protein product [Fraxinus pennsylvanica]|uniref:Replication protein A OB domain-containing protein n=1 Tax=Fraxinus pennsylvanica TaxID=56036 RepID=A0AAD2DQN2_9LAMI|nr:unnamed protein product [Fraxinus pennsylvanica]
MDTKTEIDIIGIAIDIFPKRVIQVHDNQSTVQDVILINERFETRILQMWDNFVSNECHTVCNTITKKPVLVGSRLKVTSFNGISVSTKLNSSVLINPPFEQVLQLKNWLETNITTTNTTTPTYAKTLLDKSKYFANTITLHQLQEQEQPSNYKIPQAR